jgi:hypothetical protein
MLGVLREDKMSEQTLDQKLKTWRNRGLAFLTFLAVLAGMLTVAKTTYLYAQKIEVYISLPDWLGRVEEKVDTLSGDVKEIKRILKNE